MKLFSKTILAAYLLTLLWLVLFKFSYDISSILLDHQARELNLVPFAGPVREMADNFIVFVPFGLLLSVAFRHVSLWLKLACISLFSFAVETFQFVFAIGISDVTDLITNTLGGLFGLLLYSLGDKYITTEKLNQYIVVAGAIVLVAFVLLRVFVFRVRY